MAHNKCSAAAATFRDEKTVRENLSDENMLTRECFDFKHPNAFARLRNQTATLLRRAWTAASQIFSRSGLAIRNFVLFEPELEARGDS